MKTLYILLLVFSAMAAFGMVEFRRHRKRILSIPIRIHINGTRGKSSVTRLIGAGLRQGNIRTITKVTGTFPRLIMADGSEVHIHRRAGANIIEQLAIVKFAVAQKARALVIECMALQPRYQWITEHQIVRATVGVMTNIRMDHLDVMGPGLGDVARALGGTIPKNRLLFTAENGIQTDLKAMADKRGTRVVFTDAGSVSRAEMAGFGYIEHRENVALALAVCGHLGVDRQVALEGMYAAVPDEGVLKRCRVKAFGRTILFYNAFAANDPDSTLMIWNMLLPELKGRRMVLLNTRQDRLDRARQLAELCGRSLEMDLLLLIGESTDAVAAMAVQNGVPREKIANIGYEDPDTVFDRILSFTRDRSAVVAIGNMGGRGADIAAYFEHREGRDD